MKSIPTLIILFLPLAWVFFSPVVRGVEEGKPGVDYNVQIKPLFQKNCVSCHGPEKQKGGLRLDSGGWVFKGGNSGPAVIKGKSSSSRLYQAVAGLDTELVMPPAPKPKLSPMELQLVRKWIDQGAVFPPAELNLANTQIASGHWAFQPIRNVVSIPQPAPGLANPIDGFIFDRLRRVGFSLSPRADPVTLLRRVALDLTGLPPSLKEVEAFLSDTRPDAYEKAVGRILASPRYGERWARHWLDLARYADSDGYEKDSGRPFAWRYRQWVIDSLNADLPFDQFTLEQIAGDLLLGATPLQKVATGFHRNTLTNKEGGVDQEQFRVEAVIDRVNTTAKVFLGMTLQCTQCHDHKYDPFSQRDYYQMFAFFNSDEEVNLPAPFLPGEEEELEMKKAQHQLKVAEFNKQIEARRNELEKGLPSLKEPPAGKIPEEVKKALAVDPGKRKPNEVKAILDFLALADDKSKGLQKKLTDLGKAAPSSPLAQTLALGKGRKTHVLIRGDFLRPGAVVEPNTPAVLPPLPQGKNPSRLDLAQWITSPGNPLTRRVIVNWVWSKFFGRGLVNTLEDFGTQGEKPSHPELLDYLAGRFSQDGWSLKKLHRLIVTSAAYCQSSRVEEKLAMSDPYNILLGRQSRLRLDAEPVRDVFLFVGGLLDQRIGGPGVRPPQPSGISELTYANSVKWNESQGPDRYRRGLYIWFQRTSPYPTLMMFDSPDSNVSCLKRERSNTPLQALVLMNDIAFVECSRALGLKLSQGPGSKQDKLALGFQTVLSRKPTAEEEQILLKLLGEFESHFALKTADALALADKKKPDSQAGVQAAWIALARVILNLDEVIVRE
ncbi:MAG: DUF1553 domain-containing protein [Gemmataceae bacterium]|nr:DUF1553 domain-containing protein [Gemmataceae bacterium]